jgi:hypothetical protein
MGELTPSLRAALELVPDDGDEWIRLNIFRPFYRLHVPSLRDVGLVEAGLGKHRPDPYHRSRPRSATRSATMRASLRREFRKHVRLYSKQRHPSLLLARKALRAAYRALRAKDSAGRALKAKDHG